MTSPYSSTRPFTPSRRDNQQQLNENLGTSVNIATAFSNTKNGSPRSSRELFDTIVNEEEDDDEYMNYLDIRNINHEAIKNDLELRGKNNAKCFLGILLNSLYKDLSKNPGAFNTKQDINYFNHKLGYGLGDEYEIEDETEDDDDDEFGEYAEVERLVHNPAEERRQRLYVSQMSNLSNQSSNYQDSSPTAMNDKNDNMLNWQDKLIQTMYMMLKPIVFLFFMIFWIVKEPIIRIVTFFTMVVSSVAVDPLIYAWSRLPNNQNWMPTADTRRKITHWCTALLLILLSTSALKYYNSDHSLSDTLKNVLQTVEQPLYAGPSSDLSAINKRLSSIDKKLSEQSKLANNEYTKIWSSIKDYQHQFKEHVKDSHEENTKIWTAIEVESAQIKALEHKLDHDLKQTIQDQLPSMILVRTDKDGKFELSSQFYKYLQDASFWRTFLKQNKQAIDKYLSGEMTSFLEQQKQQGAVISKDAFMKLIANDLIHHHHLQNQDISGDSPTLDELIQTAVRSYHQDVLNTADFALESRGASIIHSKTSATYQPLSFWALRLLKTLGVNVWDHPPELAIRANTNVGDCWTMAGSEGTLAILLSQPIHIQSVTIDHPSRELLLDGIQSAPKDLEFFGLPNYPKKDPFYLPLGSVHYNIENSSSSIQTFDLQMHPIQPSKAVLVKVNSNWGNPNHTDIYRIRVHGMPAKKP